MRQVLSIKKPPIDGALKPCVRDFWLVWNVQTGRFRHKHKTRESAIAEMKRLSAKAPDTTFVLLHREGYIGTGIDRDGVDPL